MRLTTLAVLASFIAFPAAAQEVKTGVGLICDTQEQVVQFVENFKGDQDAALKLVNETANVCGIMGVAYFEGERVTQVTTPQGIADVVQIMVIAVNIGGGWIQGTPMLQYTLVLLKGSNA